MTKLGTHHEPQSLPVVPGNPVFQWLQSLHFEEEEILQGARLYECTVKYGIDRSCNFGVTLDLAGVFDEDDDFDFEDGWPDPYTTTVMLRTYPFTGAEKKWVARRIGMFNGEMPVSVPQALRALMALMGKARNYILAQDPSEEVALLLNLADLICCRPDLFLAVRQVSLSELGVLAGEEPDSLDYLAKHPLPATEECRKAYAQGLQTRALSWKEAAPLFGLDAGTLSGFLSVKTALKAADPTAKAAEAKSAAPAGTAHKGVYVVRQYSTADFSLLRELGSPTQAAKALGRPQARSVLRLLQPWLAKDTIVVKEHASVPPDGSAYKSWYALHKEDAACRLG